jgi:manganese oxidase
MFTLLKVRPELQSYADPGWYQAPEGTRARPATAEELVKDGVKV